jgi:hypothetical protein
VLLIALGSISEQKKCSRSYGFYRRISGSAGKQENIPICMRKIVIATCQAGAAYFVFQSLQVVPTTNFPRLLINMCPSCHFDIFEDIGDFVTVAFTWLKEETDIAWNRAPLWPSDLNMTSTRKVYSLACFPSALSAREFNAALAERKLLSDWAAEVHVSYAMQDSLTVDEATKLIQRLLDAIKALAETLDDAELSIWLCIDEDCSEH